MTNPTQPIPYVRGNVSAGKREAAARIDFSNLEIPHRNSSMTERYVSVHQQVRAGGDAFLAVKSRGN